MRHGRGTSVIHIRLNRVGPRPQCRLGQGHQSKTCWGPEWPPTVTRQAGYAKGSRRLDIVQRRWGAVLSKKLWRGSLTGCDCDWLDEVTWKVVHRTNGMRNNSRDVTVNYASQSDATLANHILSISEDTRLPTEKPVALRRKNDWTEALCVLKPWQPFWFGGRATESSYTPCSTVKSGKTRAALSLQIIHQNG
jgi:hypothetical protein